MSYDWNFSFLFETQARHAFANGIGTTLFLTAITVTAGTPLGFFLGILACLGDRKIAVIREFSKREQKNGARYSRVLRILRYATLMWIDLIRAIPLLVLILLVFYAIPWSLKYVGLDANSLPFKLLLDPVWAAAIAMIVNLSAFVADLVRASVSSASVGNVLAARSLGMGDLTILRRIVLPDTVRELFPGLFLLWITMFKMSTLASAIAVYEILHAGQNVIMETFRPLEVFAAIGGFFVVVTVPLSSLARWLEGTTLLKRRSP